MGAQSGIVYGYTQAQHALEKHPALHTNAHCAQQLEQIQRSCARVYKPGYIRTKCKISKFERPPRQSLWLKI
ncbi:hypothetical protein [Helicobacter labacensis]|uniref:hypothetical protein n=1 Tax=Helicobacter labacensis TaxID=2316079 RepID=UPI000EB17355|nr:hypothetical protein [Helicobacter labacensis]